RTAAAQGRDERPGPPVLVDENRGGASGLERSAGLVEVVLRQDAGGRTFELREIELAVAVEIGDRDPADAPGLLLLHEGEVDDADEPALDEVDEDAESLPGRLCVRGPLDDEVIDRT